MKYIVFTGGEFAQSSLSKQYVQEADIIIAADSGANTAVKLGIIPLVVLGDMDSIDEKTRATLEGQSTQFIVSSPEKDETDTELALDYAIKHGATEISVLGGTAGNRLDHVLANVLIATKYNIPIYFIDGLQISWVVKGPVKQKVFGQKGDLLSLLPITTAVEGITTKNLYYPLSNGTLLFGKPRGVSNVFIDNEATVSFEKGLLLFVHTSRDGAE